MPASKAFDFAAPLRDAGTIRFAAEDWDTYPRLLGIVRHAARSDELCELPGGASLRYGNSRALLRLLDRLQKGLRQEEQRNIRFQLAEEEPPAAWTPLAALFDSIAGRGVAEYILHLYFTTYLQPIVQPSGRIAGYECLLRPLPEQAPFRPAELFEKARKIRQHAFLDRNARKTAIRVSAAHLPQGVKRFVNFLPSSLYGSGNGPEETFEAMRETGTDPADVVFEVVETEPLDHPEMAGLFDRYRREGIRFAVDDVGTGHATVEAIDRLRPDYVKLDRKFVSRCERDPEKQRRIDDLLERASRFHGIVLAEGVEREEEWQYLRRAGVPLLQGYLFGPAAPIPAQGLHALASR